MFICPFVLTVQTYAQSTIYKICGSLYLQVANSHTNYSLHTTKTMFKYSLCASTQNTVHFTTQSCTCFKIQVCLYSAYLHPLICNIQGKRLKRKHVYYFSCKFILCKSFYTHSAFIQTKFHTILLQQLQSKYNTTSTVGISGYPNFLTLYYTAVVFSSCDTTYLTHTKVPFLKMSIILYHVWFTNTHASTEKMLNPQQVIPFLFIKFTPFWFDGKVILNTSLHKTKSTSKHVPIIQKYKLCLLKEASPHMLPFYQCLYIRQVPRHVLQVTQSRWLLCEESNLLNMCYMQYLANMLPKNL